MRKDHVGDEAPPKDVETPPEDLDADGLNQSDYPQVPPAYSRQKIELRHPVDDPQDLYLYDNGVRVCKIKLLYKKENARTLRPQSVPTNISFHKGRILP